MRLLLVGCVALTFSAAGTTVVQQASVRPTTAIVTRVAGTGVEGFTGVGGAATRARLFSPAAVAVDRAGNLYLADFGNSRILAVTATTGVVAYAAGTGIDGFSGDEGLATEAFLAFPTGVAVDGSGNLYFADCYNNRIRKVTAATGRITTVAGTGVRGFSGDEGAATRAALSSPTSVAVDEVGNLFIADFYNSRIRKVMTATGVITTVAGTGRWGFSGDGGAAASAALAYPHAVAVDGPGNLYIADFGNSRIRKVTAGTGVITTVAGAGRWGFSGDGGPATRGSLASPRGVAVDRAGNLYIADTANSRIRKVAAGTGVITTVAGFGPTGYGGGGFSGDEGDATSAMLSFPTGVALDGVGNLYIADAGNHRILKVTCRVCLS